MSYSNLIAVQKSVNLLSSPWVVEKFSVLQFSGAVYFYFYTLEHVFESHNKVYKYWFCFLPREKFSATNIPIYITPIVCF